MCAEQTNKIGEGSPTTKVDPDSARKSPHSMGAPVRRYSSKEGVHINQTKPIDVCR